MSDGPALAWKDFSFTYRGAEKPALRGVDLDLDPGQTLALMGPSGAGKTTLCSAANGVVPRLLKGRTDGEVRVHGEPVTARRVPEWASVMGLVFQDFETQLFCTEVSLEVAFGPENLGVEPGEIRRRVEESLLWAGLQGLGGREPATLSGGEKQRLVLAAVLALQPRILILDEPTTDLDPAAKEELFQLAAGLGREGRTLMVVEHEPRVLRFADRAAVLTSGVLRRRGEAADLREDTEWMRERGMTPDPMAEIRQRLDLPDLPDDPAKAGLELRRRRVRLAPPHPRSGAGDPLLEARGIEVRFPGGTRALRGVDLEICEGEILGILGPNGSGKTTLARVLAGIQPPTRGRVLYEGQALDGPRAAVGRVGLVFQDPDDQIFCSSLLEEVTFALELQETDPDRAEARGREALEAVGLAGREGEDPFALPKGDRQKTAVASVLATGPRILVLDEPTTGLDRRELDGMLALLRRLREAGHAVVMVTHSMEVAAAEADRILILAEGRVRAEGPPRQVFADRRLVEEARLRVPAVLRLCDALDGPPALTVDELVRRCVLPRGG